MTAEIMAYSTMAWPSLLWNRCMIFRILDVILFFIYDCMINRINIEK